jgi:CheY-like chemotaxis protein/HPt (histidine-containing phosphotransfer) domain-containing protein
VPPDAAAKRLILIDDDLLTREVLTLLVSEAGFHPAAYASGEEALEALTRQGLPGANPPHAILCDMQMDGICGNPLAVRLRSACGPATTILAMSGTAVSPPMVQSFDGFLLKPFSVGKLQAALAGTAARREAAPPAFAVPLNLEIYRSFRASMTAEQLGKLYAMSLDDAERRIGLMRQAASEGDSTAYRRVAHAIKGGCGMVGAAELAFIAARMEEGGLEDIDNIGACDEFLAASERLRRILDAQLR